MIPCMNKNSVKHLYQTADERYNFSRDFFRKTHFPQSLNRYYKNQLMETITEESFFCELEEEHSFGNRVYIIYGSTGSGKSEFLCWIKDQWVTKGNQRPIIRISRSELNPQVFIKKCYESLGFDLNEIVIDENRWDLLLNKPISIVNQLVWSALGDLFNKDEEIVPAAMLLRPVIEKNIIQFSKQIKKGEITSALELITKKEFESLLENTTIKIEINYHKLRSLLLKKFDEYLFQGVDIQTIFKALTKKIMKKGIQPVLLIDDLVQSMNLYASDLLDFFITLEEGNWDVVIGLTPGVIDGNEYEVELKKRIQTLDTIDDRVKKLWLSDEAGNDFYSLDKKKAKDYVVKYLLAIKEAKGFQCSEECPHAASCEKLLLSDDYRTLPLSDSLIDRIYLGLPEGKGALRYMILHMKEILNFLICGNQKDANKMKNFFNRDTYVEHEDTLIKILGEMFADPSKYEMVLSAEVLGHFNYLGMDIRIPLKEVTNSHEVTSQEIYSPKRKNEKVNHIRDWIEGNKINKELLEPVRNGVASIVQEVTKGTSMMKEDTSRVIKSSPTIQRTEVINRFKYPITFEESKDGYVLINKHINLLEVSDFQKLKMQDRADVFSKIATSRNVSEWIFQTEELKRKWKLDLEENLGSSMEHFALYFKSFINKIYRIGQSEWTQSVSNPVQKNWMEIAEDLFLDWFALRDNIIDTFKIEQINEDEHFDERFLTFNPTKVLNKFHIKQYPLQTFIVNLQKEVKHYLEMLEPIVIRKANEIHTMMDFIGSLSNMQPKNLEQITHILQKGTITLDDILYIDGIISWLSKEENREIISEIQSHQQYLSNMNKFLHLVDDNEAVKKSIMSLPSMEDYLREHLKMRSQVRKHIMNLMEKGETELPRKRWKGILRDLEEVNPEFFNHISVKININ